MILKLLLITKQQYDKYDIGIPVFSIDSLKFYLFI
jgi:hypothetical protein